MTVRQTSDPMDVFQAQLDARAKRYAADRVQELLEASVDPTVDEILARLINEAEGAEAALGPKPTRQHALCKHCALPIFKLDRYSWKHDTTHSMGRVQKCRTAHRYEYDVEVDRLTDLVATPA